MRASLSSYLTKDQVRARGWTNALIRDFLGNHEQVAPKPYSRRAGAPKCLSSLERVEVAERSEAFVHAFEKAKRRSNVAKRVAEAKRERLLQTVEEGLKAHPIQVPVIERHFLIGKAIGHYYRRQKAKRWAGCPSIEVLNRRDDDFKHRIAVNYLRHCLTDYEERLQEIAGKVGVREGYWLIKRAVLQAIASAYPFLEEACDIQSSGGWRSYTDADDIEWADECSSDLNLGGDV